MRWRARLCRRRPYSLVAALGTAAGLAALLTVPADGGAAGATQRLDPAYKLAGTSDAGQSFSGLAAVGALFGYTSGRLGSHFCTASVVHSRGGDLAVTAAHCVTGSKQPIAFVPGYENGKAPFGIWLVTQVYTDQAWQSSQDPDDDVAFLRLAPAGNGIPVEDITGAEQLAVGTEQQVSTLVQVIGYPDGSAMPVWCLNWAKSYSPTQLKFDCDGYTDGTSGGPFLADVSSTSGQGTIIGVIGGYEQGGLSPSVSYASVFGTDVASLFQAAQR